MLGIELFVDEMNEQVDVDDEFGVYERECGLVVELGFEQIFDSEVGACACGRTVEDLYGKDAWLI